MDFHFIILLIVFLVSNVVETVTGFGSTIVAVTIGANFYPISHLVAVIVPINIMLSAYIVIRHFRAVDLREYAFRILPFAGAGLAIGIAVSSFAGGNELKIAYGAFVLCFSAWELVRLLRGGDAEKQPELPLAKGALWLVAGGIVQGIYASGGPLVVYYASRKLKDKTVFRSTLSMLWLALNIVLVTTLAMKHEVNAGTLKTSAALLPSLAIGIFLGEKLHGRINERAFRVFVFALLIAAGASLLFGTLF